MGVGDIRITGSIISSRHVSTNKRFVSLGSLGPTFEEKNNAAFVTGGWVILQNFHLGIGGLDSVSGECFHLYQNARTVCMPK